MRTDNASLTERLNEYRLEHGLHDVEILEKQKAPAKPSLADLCASVVKTFESSDTPRACGLCGAKRELDGCFDGWQYADAGASMCGLYAAKLEQERLNRLMTDVGLDETKFARGWDALEVEHDSWLTAKRFGSNVVDVRKKGLNAFFYGPLGRGKTHAALLICRDTLRVGLTSFHVRWSEFVRTVRDSFSDDSELTEHALVRMLTAPDVLLIDELVDMKEFGKNLLRDVLQRRDDALKSTIITSNLSPTDALLVMESRGADRFFSRVVKVLFDGKKFRADEENTVSDLKNMILGIEDDE